MRKALGYIVMEPECQYWVFNSDDGVMEAVDRFYTREDAASFARTLAKETGNVYSVIRVTERFYIHPDNDELPEPVCLADVIDDPPSHRKRFDELRKDSQRLDVVGRERAQRGGRKYDPIEFRRAIDDWESKRGEVTTTREVTK